MENRKSFTGRQTFLHKGNNKWFKRKHSCKGANPLQYKMEEIQCRH